MEKIETPDWPPSVHGVHVDLQVPPDAPIDLLVQHTLAPFTAVVAGDADLQRFAHAYLVALGKLEALRRPEVAVLHRWTTLLAPDVDDPIVAWMPIDTPTNDGVGLPTRAPAGSVRWPTPLGNSLVTLYAAQRLGAAGYIASGFALQIGMRLLQRHDGRFDAAILALAASLPFGPWTAFDTRNGLESLQFPGGILNIDSLDALNDKAVRSQAEDLAIMAPGTCRLRGLRLGVRDKALVVERRYTAQRLGDPDKLPWALTLVGSVGSAGTLLSRSPIYSEMVAGEARVLVHDPGSRVAIGQRTAERPRRGDDRIDEFRVEERILSAAAGPLDDATDAPRVTVWPCHRFVPGDVVTDPPSPRNVTLPGNGPEVRSHDASAIQAFRHIRSMRQRMRAYLIDTASYFRKMQPQIDVFYRSGISPGPGKDGCAVNARVQSSAEAEDFHRTNTTTQLPWAQMHFGIAEPMRRARTPYAAGGPTSRAVSMGIAADARWMWHEFAHVLLLAATGEIELRFAHSPGDALASIATDPHAGSTSHEQRWRFVSFPWVLLSRRHDRSVSRGWGWNGRLREGTAALPESAHPVHKGYLSEQILSSTLFRLYRCLGGDTVQARREGLPDRPARRGASHYTLYLVMRAIQLLGDASLCSARRPEALALALARADSEAPDPWEIQFPTGPVARFHRRVPGCAHKVVRWAFEAQGLYTAVGGNVNAPGAPLPVDVYIADARPAQEPDPFDEVAYEPGHYLPVSLHWQGSLAAPAPAWQANAGAVSVASDGSIVVRVGNRGATTADAVTIRAWWARWPDGSAPPQWHDGSWTECSGAATAQDIAAGGSARFDELTHSRPVGRYVLLVASTCAADPSNLDALPALACTRHTTPLEDLVSGDNNLALLVID